jgi:hypothetical protein
MVINIANLDVLIDDEDHDRIKEYKWSRLCGNKPPFYFCRNVRKSGTRKIILLHKFIMDAPDNLEVDHKNLNTLDNRKSNLRICTHAENCRNRKGISNSTGYKGVSRKGIKYRARITKNRKIIFLGDFDTPEKAYAAYCNATIKYHEEFRRVI